MLKRIAFGTGLVGLLISAPALANKIKSMNIWGYGGYDKAPRIEVYSTNGEQWTDVDQTATISVAVGLRARCKYEGRGNKAYKGALEVPGFVRVGSKEPANFLIPHTDTASATFRWDGGERQPLDPVQACNQELTKRAANTAGKGRYDLLAEGFEIEYPAALRVAYDFRCEATGLGRTDLGGDSELINTRIQCQPSALAAEKVEADKPKPKRAAIVPARLQPLLKAGTFDALPEVHTGECPADIQFKGTLTATRAGTVRYRYTRFDGHQSPEYTLEFDKAGTKATREWQTTYKPPNAAKTLSSGNASGDAGDFQGWYRLDVLSPAPTGQITANYRVMCGADSVEPAIQLKAAPVQATVAPTRAEINTIKAAPAPRRQVTEQEN